MDLWGKLLEFGKYAGFLGAVKFQNSRDGSFAVMEAYEEEEGGGEMPKVWQLKWRLLLNRSGENKISIFWLIRFLSIVKTEGAKVKLFI